MPIMHGKSKKSFEHNVKEEMDSGKPQKQSLAIAYATKRAAMKKKAMGGEAYAEGGEIVDPEKAEKFQKGFGYGKPVASNTFDDKIKQYLFGKSYSEGGEIMKEDYDDMSDDSYIDDDHNNSNHKDPDLFSEDMHMNADMSEPMDAEEKKKRSIAKILAAIKAEHYGDE